MKVSAQVKPNDVKIESEDLHVSFNVPTVGITIKPPQADISVDTPAFEITPGAQIVRDPGVPIYTGDYEVTPSQEEQELDTQGCLLTLKVTIKPIPRNYGLVTQRGSIITVS